VSIIELHTEAGVRQNFGHQALKLDQFFFGHARLMLMAVPDTALIMTHRRPKISGQYSIDDDLAYLFGDRLRRATCGRASRK
jgi:hypothetical protein